jgi:hypothetical protein
MAKQNFASWVKLHRKITEWEWYANSEMFHLFMHLCITANHKPNVWKGIKIERGQLICTLNGLSKELGISVRKLRTCILKLQKSNEIEVVTTSHYHIILIKKYNNYQFLSTDENTTNDTTFLGSNSIPQTVSDFKEEKTTQHKKNDTTIDTTNDTTFLGSNSIPQTVSDVLLTESDTINDTKSDTSLINNKEYNIYSLSICDQNNFEIQKKIQEDMVVLEMNKIWMREYPTYPQYEATKQDDFHALLSIAYLIAEKQGWKKSDVICFKEQNVLEIWERLAKFIVNSSSNYIKRLPLHALSNIKNWQSLLMEIEVERIKREDNARLSVNNSKNNTNGNSSKQDAIERF